MDKNFFDRHEDETGEQDLSYAVEQYKKACLEGCEGDLAFSEEEFEYVIEYYINENDEERVLKVAELAFEKHPYSSSLMIKLCDSMIVSGFPDRAIDLLKKYIGSFENNLDLYFLFTRAYVRKRLFPGARDYFAMAMSLNHKGEDVVDSICSIGQDCIDLGNYSEALYYLDRANLIRPLDYEYYNDYAFCYDKLDNTEKAIEYYSKYLDADPFNDYVWFNLGTVYARLKEFDKAMEAFEYSLALNGKNDSSLYNLAVVYLNLERYKEALECFMQCYEIDGHSAASSLGIADAYLGLKEVEKAKQYFQQALDADENCEDARAGYECVTAIEQYQKGEREKFLECMRTIVKQDATWINMVYGILPQLSSDADFLNLLMESRRDGTNDTK